MNSFILLCVVFISVTFQTGESTKCYMCNSMLNEHCQTLDNKDAVETIDCHAALLLEAKTQTTARLEKTRNLEDYQSLHQTQDLKFSCLEIALSDGNYTMVTLRGCVSAGNKCDSASILKFTDGKGKVEFCRVCAADLCNESSHEHITSTRNISNRNCVATFILCLILPFLFVKLLCV